MTAGGEGEPADDRHRHSARGRERRPDRDRGRSPGQDREFGWRGWVLVGFLLVAFYVVPGALYGFAYAREVVTSVGLGWRQAYLVLPLLPAVVLGALAVWATTRP